MWQREDGSSVQHHAAKILDYHALETTKTVKMKQGMPWFNDEIKGLKRDRGPNNDGRSTEVTP